MGGIGIRIHRRQISSPRRRKGPSAAGSCQLHLASQTDIPGVTAIIERHLWLDNTRNLERAIEPQTCSAPATERRGHLPGSSDDTLVQLHGWGVRGSPPPWNTHLGRTFWMYRLSRRCTLLLSHVSLHPNREPLVVALGRPAARRVVLYILYLCFVSVVLY